jgi:hypothetical protein
MYVLRVVTVEPPACLINISIYVRQLHADKNTQVRVRLLSIALPHVIKSV